MSSACVDHARKAAERVGKHVALLGDLQGPKIRIERFAGGHTVLTEGATFTLDPALDTHDGTDRSVGMTYAELAQDVAPGDELILGDGQIELVVTAILGDKVECRVLVGGELGDQKGINRQRRRTVGQGADRQGSRGREARGRASTSTIWPCRSCATLKTSKRRARLLGAAGSHARVVAKIERSEAIANGCDEIARERRR
jgi:pyruvate kinase